MADDLRIALTTSLNDRLVAPLRRALGEVERNLKQVERELLNLSRTSQQASQGLARMQGPQQATRQAAQLARETERAAAQVSRLQAAWTAAGNIIRGVGASIAGFQAARMVLAEPMQRARTYQYQLADASNTAFNDRDLAGRKAGMAELDAAVISAVRAGGGTREQGLAALQKLLANGIAFGDANATMPGITRAATAAGASSVDIAEIVTKLLKNGFNPGEIEAAIGKAIAAGQAGSFEMKDMAQWLPKLLAAGTMSGMRGMGDFETVLAMAQTSAITAGSSAEAGNNLLNFLLKVNSSDTANDAKKLGIDLSGTLARARDRGMNAPTAFVELLRRQADADPRLVQLRGRFAGAGTDQERIESLKAQEAILAGSAVGKLLQDRQALMPAIALMNNAADYQKILGQVRQGGAQTTQANFELLASTSEFRVQQAENEKLFAQTRALEGANDAISKLSEHTTDLYQKYPELAKALEATKVAAWALAAAAGAASGVLLILGGGLKGLMAGTATRVAPVAATTISGVMNGPAATAATTAAAAGGLGTVAAIGATAGAAALAGAPILAAGMAISDRMNTPAALRSRIDTRSARIAELDQLIAASREGGASEKYLSGLAAERGQLAADRAALTQRLGTQVGGGRGSINPGISEAADAVLARDGGRQRSEDIARVLSKLDQTTAELKSVAARPVVVQLDGREIASATNRANALDARRQ